MKTKLTSRIVKNTGYLYIRMLITMIVSLYTSRLILNILGVEDFGIYNVVAGFVIMLSFLNDSMSTATQRFLAFEIGRNDKIQLNKTFNMSMIIFLIIAVLTILIAQTIGIWFVKTHLTIPHERMPAVITVFNLSVITLIFNMLSIPYNAMIIAQEQMKFFSLISVLEVFLKLFLVFLLQFFEFDSLIFYSFLILIVTAIIKLVYIIYCNINFKETKLILYFDKSLFKTLISYSGWNIWGALSSIIMGQGINILINIFFGPLVNAARAVAFQVRTAINQFVLNFQIAVNPQIVKTYAANDLKSMHTLIFGCAKYSFFLLYFLAIPIIIETKTVLKIWLDIVPDYSVIFTRLILINILIDCISGALMTAAQATGKIKVYQFVVGSLIIINLPISYIFLRLGFPPETTLYISIIISLVALYLRLLIISPLIKLNIFNFLKKVILKILVVALISIVLPLLIKLNFKPNFTRLVLVSFSSIIVTAITIYLIGLEKKERLFLRTRITNYLEVIKN